MTPIPASHADHDLVGIAAHAAGDATGAELDTALAQVAACPECATLHHDLRAIALALPALPAPARRRDFRLTPAQAASLRPSAWRRLLAPLAGPRFAFAGPLGTGLATLGIAGFLVAGAAGLPVAGTASAPAVNPQASAEQLSTLVAPSAAPAAAGELPAASLPVEAVPGSEAPSAGPLGYGPATAGGGAGTIVGDQPDAASPATDPDELPAGAASPAPEANGVDSREASPIPENQSLMRQAMDAPAESVPAITPLVLVATLALVTGVLLGGLRFVARRAA